MKCDLDELTLRDSPDTVMLVTEDGTIVHWSRGAEVLFGYAPADAIDHAVSELLGSAGARRRGGAALAGGRCRRARDLRIGSPPDGTLLYVDISAKLVPVPGYGTPLILYTKKDITHLRVQRDAELMEARFRDRLDSASSCRECLRV